MIDGIVSRVTPAELHMAGPDALQLERAIIAAQAAPDHGRLRPWRFIIIEGEQRQRLGEVMAMALRQRDSTMTDEQLAREAAKPLRAPVIVVIACSVQASGKVPELEQVMAVSAAAQNFQLALHAQGFGCQWKTGAAAGDVYVKSALGLDPADHIIGFMYAGGIAQAGRSRPAVLDAGRVRRWS